MQISKLSLRNFRSFAAADVDLAPGLNIVGGVNAAGKSTLLDALAVGLTGTARGAESGRGHEDLRRHGDRKKWAVQVVAGGETFVRREGEGPRAAVQQRIEAVLGVPGSVIRACLYSGELLRLERKDAQRMILDLAKPAAIELPEEVRDLLIDFNPCPALPATLGDLDRTYREAYARRTETGRSLKAIGAPNMPETPAGLEGFTLSEMVDQANVIRTKVGDLERERDAAVKAQAEATAAPGRLRERIAGLDRQLAGWRERIAQLPSNEDAKLRARSISNQIGAAGEGREASEQTHREAQARLAKADARLEQCCTAVQAAEEAPEVCPTCGAKVNAATRKKSLEIARDRVKAAEAEVAAARNQATEAASILQAAPDLAGLQRQLMQLDGQDAERERLAGQITAGTMDRDAAAAQLAEMEAQAPPPADVDALAARITEGRRRLDLLTTHTAALRAYEQAMRARVNAEAAREKLDRLCELLGLGGIRKDLAGGGGVQEFQSAVNAHLEPMGFLVDLAPLLSLEDDATVNGLPTRLLSSSEQIRFGLAFQVAVASACGLGLVVVDDFDRLDPGSRAAALAVLSACPHQVIVLSTITGKTPEQFVVMAAERNAGAGPRYIYVFRDAQGRSCVEAPGVRAAEAA